MLVRRERKYTLFFRLVQPHDTSDIGRMRAWNEKVEKAVGSVTGGRAAFETGTESEGDTESTTSGSSDASGRSGGLISRGRQLLPTAGKVRSRRATPTPKMRRRRGQGEGDSEGDASGSAEDGYSAAVISPLAPKQAQGSVALPNGLALKGNASQRFQEVNPMAPKDELVDVIRGLRVEKSQGQDGSIQRYVVSRC
jgi:hypothetical protein